MPASPEAASNAGGVVEQLKLLANSGTHTLIDNMDLRALLAVAEAAAKRRYLIRQLSADPGGLHPADLDAANRALDKALDAIYTPDSAESKDAEGAKP